VAVESDPVRPIALSPGGTRLFVANIPDGRLEIFAVGAAGLIHTGSVPVGLEPVAVAARSESEVWVVNQLSDSVSVVELDPTPRVMRTLFVGDEPRDIVFAGPGRTRAFISAARRGQNLRADPELSTSGQGRANVWVFDALALGPSAGGDPIAVLTLFGDVPRGLATSTSGLTVYAAIFRSGNGTASISEAAVCDGGQNAPPCTLEGRTLPGGLPAPNQNVQGIPGPETGLIVKQDPATGQWLDPLGRDWSAAAPDSLPDLDVFAIAAGTNPPAVVASRSGVGTVIYGLAANPVTGTLYVSNTEARNDLRLLPSLRGRFAPSRITVIGPDGVQPRHLNKHIDYDAVPVPPGTRQTSLALPLTPVVSSDGATLYVPAFGSGRIGVFSTSALENDSFVPGAGSQIRVSGGGPSGIALDEARGRLYVLTRFDNAVAVVDLATRRQTARLPLPSPEPASLRTGRRFLYDADLTSDNGEVACASCHVFGDVDDLAWDLGDPDASVAPNPNPLLVSPTIDPSFHPLKGPMTTQTLRGMAGQGPMHWRGDRSGGHGGGDPLDENAAFLQFNEAIVSLLGRPWPLTDDQMQAFADFALGLVPPPNPNRRLDNTLTPAQQAGQDAFLANGCVSCHVLAPGQGLFGTIGASAQPVNGSSCGSTQVLKIPTLRHAHRKVGRFAMFPAGSFGGNTFSGPQIRGFGFAHDGHIGPGHPVAGEFLLVFPTDLPPVTGQQVTLTASNAAEAGPRIDLLVARSAAAFASARLGPGATECELVVQGRILGEARGWLRTADGRFRGNRAMDTMLPESFLRSLAAFPGQELTYTCVPFGSGTRIALDRDLDGVLDGDELDAGTDPADPGSRPFACADGIDNDGDGRIDFADDPGCAQVFASQENPACQNGRDDDWDGQIDFDGGVSANGGVALGLPDPSCQGSGAGRSERAGACGLGAELALLLPLLAALGRRRRVSQR
jgi:DNA-binding beta-propeller fold protein YncE